MATTNLLDDPGHVRGDLKMMETAVSRSVANPEIPIPDAVIEAMPKIVSNMMLRSGDDRVRLRASALLLSFMEYNKSLNAAPPQGTTVNVGVKVDNQAPNTGRGIAAQVLERIRAAELSGESAESSARTSRLGD